MSTIQYPRLCPSCEYISNNPAMHSYHIKTHTPIPAGTLCDLGCGNDATIRNTSGNCICRSDFNNCTGYRQRLSSGVTNMWREGDWTHRKSNQASRTKNRTEEQKREQLAKQIKTKQQKRIILEPSYERKTYNRTAIYHSNCTYTSNKRTINPLDLPRGKQEYHLDHCVSRFVGFVLGIPIDIISAPENLKMIPYTSNASKNNKCSIHPLDLLNQTNASKILVTEVTTKIHLIEHLLP